MANVFLDEETKDRLTKALVKMAAEKGSLMSFSEGVAKLLDVYEQEVKS
jgi:F0F1-type ATP synthase delta subunit